MGSFLSSIAVQWFLRRILDWGGWIGITLLGVINFYNALPPPLQAAIVTVIEGRWQDITLGSLIPLGGLIWSQIQSFRATVKPQVVIDGQQVPMTEIPQKTVVEELTRTALGQRKETLIEKLLKLKVGR